FILLNEQVHSLPSIARLFSEIELPGMSAQALMSPVHISRYQLPDIEYKKAAVLLPIFRNSSTKEWNIILMKRPIRLNDVHSGQISFPGGKKEEFDYDMASCALRETYEELGIPPENIL